MKPTEQTELAARRSGQDEILVAALASGRSYAEAGKLADVSARTVARRMAEPAFARLVRDRRDEEVQCVAGQLSAMAGTAVMSIASCLEDEQAKTRLAAAKLVLELVLKFRHQHHLEVDVAEIREHLQMDR